MKKRKFTIAAEEEIIPLHVRITAISRKKLEVIAKRRVLNLTKTIESLIDEAYAKIPARRKND